MPDAKRPADLPEMTFKAVALGLLLALVFGAANAYLGFSFRRSCDFRWSFARDSAGSTFSPRSSEANRRLSS
jgi:hypothetical protein